MIREAVIGALQQARHTAPRAGIVLVGSLAAPLVEGAPGDLDPTFGDAGRLELPDFGPVWSLELEDDGDGFLAGGDYYCFYYCSFANFTRPFSSSGALDPDYTHPELPGTLILDTALQPDGKLVGIGRTAQDLASTLTVFRLLPDGELDATFGEGGLVQFTSNANVPHTGTAVALEPDGRIVVAGSRGDDLLVLRLLDDGAPDEAFGDAGVVIDPENAGATRLVRAPDGYRITTVTAAGDLAGSTCRVVALAADGALDQSFGTGGSVDATPDATGPSPATVSRSSRTDGCSSPAAQAWAAMRVAYWCGCCRTGRLTTRSPRRPSVRRCRRPPPWPSMQTARCWSPAGDRPASRERWSRD